jgi:lysophospholipase L1-like esterase
MFMLLTLMGCRQIEPLVEQELSDGPEFTAEIESFDPETKTALDGNSVVWSSGDQIAIFQGRSTADKYQLKSDCVGTTSGTFENVANSTGTSTESFKTNIAIYPYEEDLVCTSVTEDGAVVSYQVEGVTVPSVQTYVAGSFPEDAFLMAAITDGLDNHTLNYKNLCGVLKLQLKGTVKVKTIELKGNSNEKLSGEANVEAYPDATPAIVMGDEASSVVTLDCGDGVQLNGDVATDFYIAVPPTAFEKGFVVKVTDIMGAEDEIKTSKANPVRRSYVHTMPTIAVETAFPEIDESVLSGLSIACIGNSITQGVGAEGNPYPSQLAKRLNATVKNLGVSGTSLCEGGARTCNIGQLTEANCAGRDIVTILMGINDWAAARDNASEGKYYHLGDVNSTETNCIYGAMRMWCDKIMELKKTESCANTKFYFMTPIITSWNSSVTKTRDWDQSKTNVHGFTLREMCHVIMEVAESYDIPVIDLNLCSGIYYNSPTDENVSLYGGDGVHINGAGHTLVTDAIIRALVRDMQPEQIDLFVFAGQSNMMGAAHLAPVDNPVTIDSYEYKYQNVLKGGDKGEFVYAQNPAGDWHYMDAGVAYGQQYLDVATGKSKQSNYSSTMYFIPACRDQEKGFGGQSEYLNYPSATMAPYFAQYYSELGRKCVYAHMAKGACKIIHYFTTDAMEEYNRLISDYNTANSTSYATLTSSDLSGAGDAFDAKYKAMLRDYAEFAPDKTIANKCFVWLQGESDVHVYAQYKLRLQALWAHLQSLGFTHFFILRVGFWGSTSVINEIKAQTDFCAENENCYIVTKAPSLIPHPSANTTNWWISEPSSEYADCRDSYLANTTNHHFNEKAHKIFARRSAENINRILHLGLPPVLEEENIKGL